MSKVFFRWGMEKKMRTAGLSSNSMVFANCEFESPRLYSGLIIKCCCLQ